jgi:hypothetical protein
MLGDGKTTEWAPCQVVAVSPNEQQFLIEWNSNGKQKWVSSLNILFEGDSEEDLNRRVKAAEDGRWVPVSAAPGSITMVEDPRMPSLP